MRDQLVVRQAKQSDREAVFKFCEHSFDWGDYVPDVWDGWMKEQHSRVFTATLNGEPVGIMRVSLPKPGEAWFQAARTHPDYRRRGIATALAGACLEWARDDGAKIIRLSTDSDNYASRKTLEKLDFTRTSDFLIMRCERLQSEVSQDCRWARESEVERIWKFLGESEVFDASEGLYTVLFVWMSLERRDVERFVADRKAIIHIRGSVVDGLVLVDDTVRKLWEETQTCYIDGDRSAVSEMLKFLKAYAYREGFKRVHAFACNTSLIREMLTAAGFSRDDQNTEFIYEKTLTG
ncbi:MAG: GNAT family N-acetyltransferase [Candidatus Bathyarchaeia archaeon]